MEVGLLSSSCDMSVRVRGVTPLPSSPQCGSNVTATRLLNERRSSSSRACSSFSSVTASVFLGALRHQRDGKKLRIRGPVARITCRGGGGAGGGRLPGNQGEWPPPSHISPPGLGQFRPPPSTYVPNYVESEEEKQSAASKKLVLVGKLREGHGSWQERAAFVKELQKLGVTSEDLYNQTFVPIVTQLEMVVAAQVYESLVQSGTSEEHLQCFDESSLSLLYALRTLSARQRRSAAEYVIEKSLNVEEAQKLAWAIKDHDRRPAGRHGFTTAAGDCLAFFYHRQVIETQDKEQKEILLHQGLEVAVTDSAKERFSEFL